MVENDNFFIISVFLIVAKPYVFGIYCKQPNNPHLKGRFL